MRAIAATELAQALPPLPPRHRRSQPPSRAWVEHAIGFLIAYLDHLDGDPDLEDDNEGCCDAGDDRGTRHGPWGIPAYAVRRVA